MKKYILVGCALAGLAIGAGSVMAADTLAAASYDWNGPYVGVLAGYGWANSQHCDGVTCPTVGLGSGPTVSSSGFDAGVEIGYNIQMENIVFGLEGDYSLANINGSSPSTGRSHGSSRRPRAPRRSAPPPTRRARLRDR